MSVLTDIDRLNLAKSAKDTADIVFNDEPAKT